jgi:hypothetical protein
MSGGIFLYGGAVGPMTLKAWRRFDNAYPYTLEIDGCEWALTPDELAKLSRAAASIIRDLAPRRDGSRSKEGPRFHAEPRDGDKAVIIELGIRADGETDGFYFWFGDTAVSVPLDAGLDLLRLFEVLAGDLADMQRAMRAAQPAPEFVRLSDRYQVRDLRDWRPPGSLDRDF